MSLAAQVSETVACLQGLDALSPEIDRAAALILSTLRNGRKLLICGNGGSAAEASHFAAELVGRAARSSRPLPALALACDGAILTSLGNDYGYEEVFARQIAGLGAPGDLVICLSSSGNSANILAALREASAHGLRSIAFLGRGGGAAKSLATVDLIMPGDSGRAAQEAHLFLIHHFCTRVDRDLA